MYIQKGEKKKKIFHREDSLCVYMCIYTHMQAYSSPHINDLRTHMLMQERLPSQIAKKEVCLHNCGTEELKQLCQRLNVLGPYW